MEQEMLQGKKLGFGLLRLPQKDGATDIEQVGRMADEFIARGFTYFDTAYVYEGSEHAFREAVAKRHPRCSYTIANKMAAWKLTDDYGPEQMFTDQLERCGVDFFDYYLLHSMQPTHLPNYNKYDAWAFCRRMKAAGKIKHFGFSFHADPQFLDQVLTEHPEVEFVQLQINYLDWNSGIIHSGANYEVCKAHAKPIVVMEPVKGGMLANPKPELAQIFSALDASASPSSYALRFAASLDGVAMVLSGMSNTAQMQDNLRTFGHFMPLTQVEHNAIEQVRNGLLDIETIGCTACRYCSHCPQQINIPEIFKTVNELISFGEHERPHLHYKGMLASGATAKVSSCIECGQCEEICPQQLGIIELLKNASALLEK